MGLERFLDLTPRMFQALVDRRREATERDQAMTELMGAQLIAMVRRCGMVQWDEPKTALDYMPSHLRRVAAEKKERPKRQTKAEKLLEIEAVRRYWKLAVHGKTVKGVVDSRAPGG